MSNVLEVQNIEKYYGNKSNLTKAIAGISFNVEEGEFVGIMGALFRQIFIFFMMPLVLAMIHSIFGIKFILSMDNTKIEEISTTDDMRYQYTLTAYNKNGKTKEIPHKFPGIIYSWELVCFGKL